MDKFELQLVYIVCLLFDLRILKGTFASFRTYIIEELKTFPLYCNDVALGPLCIILNERLQSYVVRGLHKSDTGKYSKSDRVYYTIQITRNGLVLKLTLNKTDLDNSRRGVSSGHITVIDLDNLKKLASFVGMEIK